MVSPEFPYYRIRAVLTDKSNTDLVGFGHMKAMGLIVHAVTNSCWGMGLYFERETLDQEYGGGEAEGNKLRNTGNR